MPGAKHCRRPFMFRGRSVKERRAFVGAASAAKLASLAARICLAIQVFPALRFTPLPQGPKTLSARAPKRYRGCVCRAWLGTTQCQAACFCGSGLRGKARNPCDRGHFCNSGLSSFAVYTAHTRIKDFVRAGAEALSDRHLPSMARHYQIRGRLFLWERRPPRSSQSLRLPTVLQIQRTRLRGLHRSHTDQRPCGHGRRSVIGQAAAEHGSALPSGVRQWFRHRPCRGAVLPGS